jgi:succinate dehydrogenase hydrophobic anchor subunit
MESREYRGSSSSSHSTGGNDPFWLILSALLILALLLVGLPAIVAGFFGQRYTYRLLSRFGWRWSAAIWLLLSLLALLLLSVLLQHGLQQMMQRELADYVQSGKHYQFDLGRWNFGRLWSETWPVWLRTLVAVPLWGLWFEISSNARGGQTARMLVQGEQARQRRVARAQQRARKRTLRPERLPDSVAGMMVMGVPIDGDEEQE